MGSSNFAGSHRLLKLAERLQQYKPLDSINPSTIKNQSRVDPSDRVNSNRAAVLICLFEGSEGDIRVILTKRSSKLSTYSGEVSLPGGKVEEGDGNDIDTALREAKEEIGLDPSLLNVVTVLEPVMAKKGVMVTPVIGILANKEAFNPVPNASEVDVIFDAPLEMFLKDEKRRQTEVEGTGQKYLLHYFDYEVDGEKFVIWALTAKILIKAASIVYQKRPEFEEGWPPSFHRSRH